MSRERPPIPGGVPDQPPPEIEPVASPATLNREAGGHRDEGSAFAGVLRDAKTLLRAAWELDRTAFLVQVALLFLAGLTGGVSLLLLVPIVNSIAGPGSAITLPVFGDVDLSTIPLWLLLLAFVALTAASAAVTRASTIRSAAMQQRLVDSMRQSAFEAILGAKWSYVLSQQKSDIIEIVTAGANRSGLAFQQLVQFGITAVLFIATAIVALLVSPLVAGVGLLGMVVLAVARASAIRPAYRLGREFGRRNRELQSVIQDSMDSLRLVRAHGGSAVWAERLSLAFSGARSVQLANIRRSATVTAVSAVGLAAAASALVLLAVQFDVSPAALVVVLVLVARLARYVQSLTGIAVQLANLLPAVQDLSQLKADASVNAEVPGGASARSGRLAPALDEPLLQFQNVSYTYPGSENGVTDISFGIPAGRVTALSGPSGAGKSTLADLALGLLEPDAGSVAVAGRELVPADLPWWRSHVAYVPQETVLVPGTLRDNLTWSAPGADDEACWAALDKAAASFARRLPDGLDTRLGDRGLRLSGGERQRVAIARALLRSPNLLVLDEATSALDEETEAQVIALMRSLVPAVTVLVIAHRRSTLDAADQVVRLASGRIVPTASEPAPGEP